MSTTIRKCLKCGEPFPSTGNGHRICETCNRANATLSRRLQGGGRVNIDSDALRKDETLMEHFVSETTLQLAKTKKRKREQQE